MRVTAGAHPFRRAIPVGGSPGSAGADVSWLPDHLNTFFDADGPDGLGSLGRFLALWDEHIAGNGPDRRVVLATADHDFSRLHAGDRGLEQLAAAYAFLLTWGTVPSIYYGEEIGMRYLPGLPDLEGSVCNPRLQPRRLPHADAVGRRPCERRVLRR
jgi:maltose alpha-D-glucosyltransferase/alpha-amylase